jgi:hypothetical protein
VLLNVGSIIAKVEFVVEVVVLDLDVLIEGAF